MKRIIPTRAIVMVAACCHPLHAAPAPPDWIRTSPSPSTGQISLVWSPSAGATGYNVKRGTSPDSVLTTIGSPTAASFTDTTALPGTRYFYTVTSTDASGESPPTHGVLASTSVIVDNGDPGTSSTGSWSSSSLSGSFGSPSVYAGPVAGSTPNATYIFVPDLPARGNYDVYLRWTADPNRATNTPVDITFPDGNRTFTINQELNHATWIRITTITAESGSSATVTIRNNGANGNVVADAVQFVPRESPWAPDAENLSEYTLVTVDEHFDGSSLNNAKWSTFLGRGEYTVGDGRLHTKLRYKGIVPIGAATTVDLENEANWAEGGIVADHATKFGYHEARLRLPQLPARGVDIAYWHAATDELLTGYEIDAPEFFNKDADGSSNNYGFGVWDHIDGDRTWDYHANHSTLGNISQYVTIGLEWRTDNSQVVYVNGAKVYTVPTSGMNDTESILPSNIILSTKVLDWMHPNAALDGTEATWDYARFYQKPGFLGVIDGDWDKSENWGPDGLPLAGYAAVFNMPSAPAAVTLGTHQTLQSILLDGASLPAHAFGGTGALKLGAGKPGDPSVTHGGILVNTSVSNNQTFGNPVIGLSNLQFANLSRTPGNTLFLNGQISGDGLAPRDVDFVSPLATIPSLGIITLSQPLGSGIRHINRAGDSIFNLPPNSQHSGELRIARGPVAINSVSALGITPDSAVVFRPRYKHSDSWRPRLTYTGSGETSAHVLKLGGWQADGILESTGNGPLVWNGDVAIAPYAELPKQVLTRDISLTLGATASSGENVFSGIISDAGVTVTYLNSDGSPNTAPATLRINKTGAGIWSLTGNNAYCGATTINGGVLIVNSLNSVNGGTPLLPSSSLGTPQTVEKGTIAITSGTLRYTGPGETTDRVLHLAGSSGATLDQAGSGLLKFTSDLTTHASAKTLTLTGTGSGEISGVISDHSPSNKTSLAKSGTGTWRLSSINTYSGNTTVSAGTLVVDGSIAAGGALNLSTSAARLTGTGTIATSATISGTLVASPLAFTGALTLGSFGKLLANFTANHTGGISPVAASTVTVNNGAKVDVTLDTLGSTTNFLQSWWRSARSIPLLTATTKTGSLSIGTVTADSAGNPAATYGSFTLQQTATAVNLIWTPLPGFPVIDTPTVTINSPAADPVAIADIETHLHLSANIIGNAAATWLLTDGPGSAIFENPDSAETKVQFTHPGTYHLRITATNALGSAQADLTVYVAPPTTLSFRQGENNFSHQTTFIRGDSPTWNSGLRDQILIGRNGAGMRGLMDFDLSSVPASAVVENAALDLNIVFTGTGTLLNTLHLHPLLTPFTEGSGDGNSATNGTGTGADWQNSAPPNPWSAPGAASGTDFAPIPIASLPGFNPSTTTAGTSFTFADPALALTAESAIAASSPLRLLLKMHSDDSGGNVFARFCSDDHSTVSRRPRLTLQLAYDSAPTIDPGTDPSPTAGVVTELTGFVANARNATWSQLAGPGIVSFNQTSEPSTSAMFPAAGTYILELSASNENGNTSRTLEVTVLTHLQSWRHTHFNTTTNTGDAADNADPDHDGLANLLEFATGYTPNTPNGSITYLTPSGLTLEFTYPRSHAAVTDGVQFIVEWSTLLSGDWSTSGVTQTAVPDTDNGVSTIWKATLPTGTHQRFVRLKTTSPNP
jgi:autotransporter-associated beta strand protein